MSFPHADYLTNEEINYELVLRNYKEETDKDIPTKLRLLRKLFQTDQKEGRDYRSPYRFEQEVDIISNRVLLIQQEWQGKEGDPRLVSRLKHYYLRVRRGKTTDKEVENTRRELLRSISETLRTVTDKYPGDDESKTNPGTLQGHENQTARDLGAYPKNLPLQSKPDDDLKDPKPSQPTYEELQEKIRELQSAIQQMRSQGSQGHERRSRNWKQSEPGPDDLGSDISEPEMVKQHDKEHISNSSKQRATRTLEYRTDVSDSEGDEVRRTNRQFVDQIPYRHREYRHNPNRENERRRNRISSDDRFSAGGSYSTDGYHHRNGRQIRRIEHWKLSFSGDNRTVSVENFLYKLKKIAAREGVSQQGLLRDIHLVLDGQASDWFFTYVDEFEDWEDFEEKIRFRFGNPNQDQGIRQKIHDRKQLRGESFSAFVSEIERLNKMLSRPLSKRRKFEVVWDNMRPHYRSKISIVRVRDLEHLIQLNHRIDAADSSFQIHNEFRNTEQRNQRNVHQIECASSQDECDEPEGVDVVDARMDHRGQMSRRRVQPTFAQNTSKTNQQQTSESTGNACWNCRKTGHNWRDCKEPRAIFCYGCGELGRTIRSCQRCAESNRRWNAPIQGNQ